RDAERFRDCLKRTDVLPLGSGALAGAPYKLDRESVAQELGFSRISQNSMDAVSDRDFVVEYESAAALAMMHLSRLSEELVLWSSAEFGFIEINDAYATGSSIMPQKKNPDVAELARGKTGRVYGHLMGMLTTLKGLPLTYNRDLQEDKEGLFDTIDTLLSTLEVFAGMVRTLHVNQERCQAAAGEGYLLATDVADYLVGKGLPFREAHGVVGRLVRFAVGQGKPLFGLSLQEFKQFSSKFDRDVFAIDIASSLAARDVPGGTAPARVEAALERAMNLLRGAQ
ncbi:MAG TPA: argininosuccinate lyase, partial [Dehalococcoidia bacterium]|nr:argininosuccinate lyase [Dehalococcoidia bacterium]